MKASMLLVKSRSKLRLCSREPNVLKPVNAELYNLNVERTIIRRQISLFKTQQNINLNQN